MKLLGISGSLRKASTNTMLVHEAARIFAPDEFVLADLDLPLYNGDVEDQGMPASVQTLIDQIWAADAIVISTPEYNRAPSGVFKNALDWVSRPRPAPMVGKPVAVMQATASPGGGERARFSAYLMLVPFMVNLVTDPEVNVGSNYQKFDDAGRLTDDGNRASLEKLMAALRAAV